MGSPAAHPFMPPGLVLPKNYVPAVMPVLQILGTFFGIIGTGLVLVWFVTRKLGMTKRLQICWMVTSGLIHIILEGYFIYYNKIIVERQDFMGEVWKEYAKADSRYLLSDTFVVSMEGLTAIFCGPMCLLTAAAIFFSRPERYFLQLVVSVCQLYGCVVYYSTEWLAGFEHENVNDPLSFWFYFGFLNSLWIVIPFTFVVEAFYVMRDCCPAGPVSKTGGKKKLR